MEQLLAAELASASGDSTISFAIVDNALDYLVGKYLIETRELSGPRGIKPHHLVLSIRASSMDLVENPTATKPSVKLQHNVHFNAPVASVQIGDNTVANGTQNLNANMERLPMPVIGRSRFAFVEEPRTCGPLAQRFSKNDPVGI